MKRGKIILVFIFILLVGFVFTQETNAVTSTQAQQSTNTNISNEGTVQAATSSKVSAETAVRVRAKNLTKEQIRNIIQEKNRLRIQAGECPENCTCSGSTVKCSLPNGGREMTVTAGKSGNMIFQVKGVNASTNVTLYKAEGKFYGVFNGNQTREVRALPDAVKERIRERIQTRLENEEMELNEDGNYDYQARKRARLFGFIPVKEKVKAKINAETGEVIKVRNSWWGFLARDRKEDLILGGTCGTVSPNSRDECCQNKGFDFFDEETNSCEFAEEE